MIDWILKPLLIVALAALCCLFTKRAALRHLFWTLAFAGLLLLQILPQQAVVQVPIPATWTAVADPNPASDNTTVYAAPYGGRRDGFSLTGQPRPPMPVAPHERMELVIRMLWFAGIFACWARVAQGLWTAYQLTASAMAVSRYGRATVHETFEHPIPFTWGFLRPAILLPSESRHWNSTRTNHVLAHEHAHIQRADWLTQTIAQLLCGFYWFHPAIWYAAARMRRESERACDDAVVRAGCIAEEYAEDLLDLARHDTKQQPQPSVAAVAMWSRSQLEERIMRILNNPDRRGVSRVAAVTLGFAAIVALAPLASITVLAQSTITYEGNVSDPSGARVPGVNLRIVEGKNTLTSAVSGPDGSYKLAFPTPATASGPFLLIAEKPGFAAASYPIGGFGTKREFIRDIALNMGQIRENVLVEGVRTTPRAATSTSPQRIRVGGNVQAANLINRTEPEYPKELQEKGIEGTVELEAIISKEGNMLSVHPRSRAVDQGLIDAATKAVQTWQYRPTLLNGNPVEIVTTVTVRFLLK